MIRLYQRHRLEDFTQNATCDDHDRTAGLRVCLYMPGDIVVCCAIPWHEDSHADHIRIGKTGIVVGTMSNDEVVVLWAY